ncbi:MULTISPECIES: TetR/AcrR family transcriptional regulator [unclassified Sphingomonas]|uniref:TetR/AcrR family transcriptional regulator n=1 Tax=Novosphingobium rhizosphaerae TaxID=1551649 RepID=UPI0015C81556
MSLTETPIQRVDAGNPGRGRPRQFDPDAALLAALRVFWTRGYDGASLSELTEAMGITRPSLYACFGNKEALFRKALDLYERDKLAFVREALGAPTARGVMEALLGDALTMLAGRDSGRACFGVMNAVASTTYDESMRREVIARRSAYEQAILDRFVRAEVEGDFPGYSAPSLAAHCLCILSGMSVQASAGADAARLHAIAETALSLWPGR